MQSPQPFQKPLPGSVHRSHRDFLIPLVKPRRSWDRITPEFPRAPLKDPEEIALHRGSISGFSREAHLFCGRCDRQRHVGTGISIRNREYIQLIDPFFVGLQVLGTAQKHFSAERGIYRLDLQNLVPPYNQSIGLTPSTKTLMSLISMPVNSSTLYLTLLNRLSATAEMLTP